MFSITDDSTLKRRQNNGILVSFLTAVSQLYLLISPPPSRLMKDVNTARDLPHCLICFTVSSMTQETPSSGSMRLVRQDCSPQEALTLDILKCGVWS